MWQQKMNNYGIKRIDHDDLNYSENLPKFFQLKSNENLFFISGLWQILRQQAFLYRRNQGSEYLRNLKIRWRHCGAAVGWPDKRAERSGCP